MLKQGRLLEHFIEVESADDLTFDGIVQTVDHAEQLVVEGD